MILCVEFGKVLPERFVKSSRFGRASGCVVLGIEIDNHGIAPASALKVTVTATIGWQM